MTVVPGNSDREYLPTLVLSLVFVKLKAESLTYCDRAAFTGFFCSYRTRRDCVETATKRCKMNLKGLIFNIH